MNPHHLELFYHVAKCKGVSRAVRQMPYGIQQPSVSAQVNALERELGVVLYERRPFRLTPAGETLFNFVEPFFGRLAEVRESLQGAAQLRIGASPIIFNDYLPPVLNAVQRQFPRLSMILRALNQPELIEAIERDELDIVISLVPDNLSPNLCSFQLVRLPLVILVARTSKIRQASELWADHRITEPLIALKPNELICQRFQETIARRGLSWLPKIEMDSLDLIETYVEQGFGVGLSVRVPGKKVSPKVRVLDLPEFPPVTLAVITREKSDSNRKACRAFLDEVKKRAVRFAAMDD